MSASTLEQYSELAGLLAWGTHPILPRPEWGQDVAYVAFVIDSLKTLNAQRYDEIERLRAQLIAAGIEVPPEGVGPSTSPS